jgi:hypothetical protein
MNKKKSLIEYSPVGCTYLNPKDNVNFSFQFTPDPDVDKYEIYWRIIAKNCNCSGRLYVTLTPTVEEYDEIHYANCQRDIPEGADVIKDLKPYIRDLAQKMNLENK